VKKVLIISSQMHEQELLQGVANGHRPGDFSFETTGSFGQDVTYWTSQAPDVLILSLPDDDLLQGYYFTKLRKDIRRDQAIIFICSQISSPLMQMSLHFTKVRMMKNPIEASALYRSVIDLTQDYEEGRKQISPRYLTEQAVEVRSDSHEGRMKAVMKNLSVTGAYFETLESAFNIRSGDFVRLSVFVGEPVKLYVFDVRVVWAAEKESGTTGYGCVFVDKDEVYNNLLKNM
jgi:hypothetical protein